MMLCAVIPAVMFCRNLRLYAPPTAPDVVGGPAPRISVLIPVRNEEGSIGPAVASVLRSVGVEFEVVVMDDCSTDRTAEIVRELARWDSRVRLEEAPGLPKGWNGKQHACWSLAHTARYELMCFVDADVQLEQEALLRMVAFLKQQNVGLVSGFPREETVTWLEWLLLPLIHFVLLGFLPISRMRKTTDPSLAAGCGQFILVQRRDYFACGGHSGIKTTMHDGLLLPRLFRQHGFRTDLADITELANCRMYRSAREVWQGLAKNATEGLADPMRILPVSLLLVFGQVLPFVLVGWFAVVGGASAAVWTCLGIGVAGAWLPRVLAAARFRQDWRGVLLHPVGIFALLAVQWFALGRRLLGGAVSWKGRTYAGN